MAHGHAHEEAEHASHHAADPFDKRVAMTMVVVAAVLAMVKVQGHRTHNDTLAYQIKAGVHHTRESDQWNFFQAKKMRQHMYDSQADLLEIMAPADKQESPAFKKKLGAMRKQAKRYREETKAIEEKARKEQDEAEKYLERSVHTHHQADFFDLGELGVELAMVLCSVAILTKRAGFWYSGMAIGVVGLIGTAIGFFVH